MKRSKFVVRKRRVKRTRLESAYHRIARLTARRDAKREIVEHRSLSLALAKRRLQEAQDKLESAHERMTYRLMKQVQK